MRKTKAERLKIGGISFTQEGYENFVTLTRKEQFKQVYNSLNPRDEVVADKALKNVPNGDNINKGSKEQDKLDNTSDVAVGSESNGSKGSKIDTGKGK